MVGKYSEEPETIRSPPGTTPQVRENQLISLAVDLAEKQLRDGTATTPVITHYLKLGSSRERLEQERLAKENILLDAKAEELSSRARTEQVYAEALAAMRRYSGHTVVAGEIENE